MDTEALGWLPLEARYHMQMRMKYILTGNGTNIPANRETICIFLVKPRF